MNTKLIPPLELAWTRGTLKGSDIINELSSTIRNLQEIKRLQAGDNRSVRKKFTITYSIPKPGSTFHFKYTPKEGGEQEVNQRAFDIDSEYTNGDISIEDVHSTFRTAFNYYIELFSREVPGLEIELMRLNSDYEKRSRHISYEPNNIVPVKDEIYRAGDIKLIFTDFYPRHRLAYAYGQFNPNGSRAAPLGVKSNAGLTILFNTDVDFRRNDDPALFAYPQVGFNDILLHRYSLLTVMIHEIGHLFGVRHFPTSNANLLPSIMNSNIKSNVPFEYIFPNRLWSDYWLRANLADLYKYSLDHMLAGERAPTTSRQMASVIL